MVYTTKLCVFHKKLKNDFFLTLKLVMPFINTYNSCNIVSEIYNNQFYKTYSNKVYAYGNNYDGYLGVGSDNIKVYIPQKVLIEEKIKDITLKYNQTYFTTIDDEYYACGDNKNGHLGIGSHNEIVCIPQKVLIEEKIKDIKYEYYRIYFITFDNTVYTCGNNEYGQLGIGSYTKYECVPQKVLIEEKIKNIKGYYDYTHYITINDEVYGCGKIMYGFLGIGSHNKVACIPQKIKKMIFFFFKTCNAVY